MPRTPRPPQSEPTPPRADHAITSVLAEQLGLTLQGDADLNLLFATPEQKEHIGMTGSPYGRRAALTSFTWGEGELLTWSRGVVQALWVATTTETVPDFEVTLRHPEQMLAPTVLFELGRGILEARTGDAALDERFRIVTDLPIVAPLLRPALERLADQRFVHLFHSGRAPGLLTSIADGPGFPYVLRAADEHLYALELLACSIEGRRAPKKRTSRP